LHAKLVIKIELHASCWNALVFFPTGINTKRRLTARFLTLTVVGKAIVHSSRPIQHIILYLCWYECLVRSRPVRFYYCMYDDI